MDILKDPEELEQHNRQEIIRNLNDVYISVEKLVQRTHMNKQTDLNFQLRNIRTSVSQLLADIKNRDLDGFSGKKGTLEEFYRTENQLLEDAAGLNDTFASTIRSNDTIDVFLLDDLIESFKKGFNRRIIVDKEILNEFKLKKMEASSADRVISGEKKIPVEKRPRVKGDKDISFTYGISGSENVVKNTMAVSHESEKVIEKQSQRELKEEIDTEVLSKLYNYMNVLENKYSSHQPEVSFDGEYIGDKKWKMDISDKHISGTIIQKMLLNAIVFETYWKPLDDLRTIMQFIQKQANTVPAGQYKSLCLLNSNWNTDIKDWVKNYIHPRLVPYLYELETSEIIYNGSVFNADKMKVWHNPDTYQKLEYEIQNLIDREEPFDESEVADITGLNVEGAKKFLAKMIAENKIVDVGLEKSLYTKLKE